VLTKESQGKLRIHLSFGRRTGFEAETGTMYLNVRDIASQQYRTADGLQPFSLQRVLVHELAGHGSDGSLTPEKELNQRKQALTKALVNLFTYYPDLAAEYRTSRTILGKPVGDLFSALDYDMFDKKYFDLLGSHEAGDLPPEYLDKPQEYLEREVVRKFQPSLRTEEVLGTALNILYRWELSDIIGRQDEAPAIELENRIMEKYYGEARRVGYRTVGKREAVGAPLPSLAAFTYPAINVNPNKLVP
jgi:hypothetical protein